MITSRPEYLGIGVWGDRRVAGCAGKVCDGEMVSQMYTYVKTDLTIHLKYVQFISITPQYS